MLKLENRSGFFFAISLGIGFFLLAPHIQLFNAVILGLLGGVFIGNILKLPANFDSGIKFTGSKLLEISILFLAFDINLTSIKSLGISSFVLVFIMVFVVLATTYFLSKKLNCPGSTGFLVGFGTAICGSSAIAALSPSVAENKEDVGISLAVVNLLGTLGMLGLPIFLTFMKMNETESGILIGASLHAVGNVAGAGYGMSEEIGKAAITMKLARVALLPIAVIAFSFFINRKKSVSWKEQLRLPYYLWGFILISILVSFFPIPTSISSFSKEAGKLILTIAMTAIGLKVGFKTLFYSGRKALAFGSLLFAIQLIIIFLLLLIF
jgi:uncharacterized integral membrane protein (TIGR00698 family)